MRPTLTRSTQALACAAALLTLAACGGDADGEKTSASSSASPSSEPTYDDAHLMAEVTEIDKKFQSHDRNKPIPKSASWATDDYRKVYNDDLAALKEQGVVQKGKTKTTGLHIAESNPDAPGGWDLTAYVCVTSTLRYYIDGEDVSADRENPDQPLPKGPRDFVALNSFVTSDNGKTWRLDDSETLSEARAKDSPCAS